MTDSGIALCFLLIICGAQGFPISATMRDMESKIALYEKSAEELEKSLTSAFESVKELADNLTSNAISDIESMVGDWQEGISSLPDDVVSCTTSNFNISEIAKSYITNGINCVAEAMEDIVSNYEIIISSLSDVIRELSEITSAISTCNSSKTWGCPSSQVSVLTTLTGIASKFIIIPTTSAELITQISMFKTTAETCAVTTLTNAALESKTAIAKCIASREVTEKLLSV